MLRRAPVKLALFGVLSAVLLLPGVLYALTRSANPFVYYRVARAEMFTTAGHLLPIDVGTMKFDPARLGTELLLISMNEVTGLPVEVIQYLPLGLVFTALAYLALTKAATGSNLLAYLVAFSIAFDGMMSVCYDSANVWSWQYPFTVLFLLALLLFLRRPSVAFVIVLIILYGGLYTIHVPGVFWTILEVTAVALLVLAARAATRKPPTFAIAYTLPLLFLVTEFAFDDALYFRIKHFASGGYFNDFFIVWLPTVIQKLLGQTVVQERYLFAAPLNLFTAWVTAIKPVLLTIPLIIYLIARGVKLVKLAPRHWPSPDPATALLVAIVSVGVMHMLIYLVYGGSLSLHYLNLMYPLAAVIALRKLGVKRVLTVGLIACWCVVSVVGTAGYLKDFPRTPSYQEVKTSYSWLQQHGHPSPSILTDLDTYGKLTTLGSYEGNLSRFRTYDVERYGLVVEDDKPAENRLGFLKNDIDYVIIASGPYEDNPITESSAWRTYEPLSLYRGNIENNAAMMKVYDGSIIEIFFALQEIPEAGH